MTRKKVKLAYISNDAARKATFKKRKKGLMKKVKELSTLCGIEACAIVYSPYESAAEVWPSAEGVERVVSEFKELPEMEQSKKMVNQESFLGQRIAKANEQLRKQCKENREKEMRQLMFQALMIGNLLQDLNMMDLNEVGWLIDQNLKDIHKRVDSLNKSAAAAAAAPTTVHGDINGQAQVHAAEDHRHHHQVQSSVNQQWAMMNPPQHHQHVAFGSDDDYMTMHAASLWG